MATAISEGASAATGTGAGGQTQAGGTGNTQAGGGTPGGVGGAGGGAGAPSWRDALPEEVRNDPSVVKFSDVGQLAKGYISAQKMIGAKGVILPGEKATPEEWEQFYDQIGRPALDKYALTVPQGAQANAKLLEAFKGLAHKSGLSLRQAQPLLEGYLKAEGEITQQLLQEQQAAQKKELDGLKKEWGPAYADKIRGAAQVATDIGGKEFFDYLEESGLGDDVRVLKFLDRLRDVVKDDALRGDGGDFKGKSTPAELQKRIDTLYTSMLDASLSSAKKDEIQKELDELHAQLYPKA